MNNAYQYLKAFIITFFIPSIFWCQGINSPKYSNEFMNIGIGARSLGMSNSVITSTNDVTSGYWNPANLTKIESDLQVGLMHAEYFAGIAKYDYGAVAKNIDEKSAFAFSFLRFGVDNIPNTTELIDAESWSCVPATREILVVPNEAIHIELTWDTLG